MSRIGAKPVAIPKGVEVTIAGTTVTVKGPKGTLSYQAQEGISVQVEGSTLHVKRARKDLAAAHGLARALIANMIRGVHEGFSRSLQIEGVGFRAALKGRSLELNVGYTDVVQYPVPQGIEIQVETPQLIHVRGADKQLVGQVAAEIRQVRPPEPYQGKGIRYFGERIRRKAGKAAA